MANAFNKENYLCIAIALFSLLTAKISFSEVRTRDNAWNIGLIMERMNYKAQNEDFVGNRGVLSFGYGKFQDHIYFGVCADIVMGPYTKVLAEEVKTDFYGTGFGSKAGYAFGGSGFRNQRGSLSLDLGLNYSDTVGRSISRSATQSDGTEIHDLSMRISQFSGTFALSYNALQPARALGNSPELLTTRLEGYQTSVGISYPIKATYSMRYQQDKSGSKADDDQNEKTKRGSLTGYSLFASITAYLGV